MFSRCGPSAVAAVKEGEVLRPYDTSFLFAEVNADKVIFNGLIATAVSLLAFSMR